MDEFKFYTTAEVYKETFMKLNNGDISFEQDKRSMTTLTYQDVLRKFDKETQRKKLKELRYITKKYDDNCVLVAANHLCKEVTFMNYQDNFRGQCLNDQINTLNSILVDYNMVLVEDEIVYGEIFNVVDEIKGKALISFIVGGKVGHVEAIEDGKPMDKQSRMLEKYGLLKTNLVIYKLEEYPEDGSSSVEVESITID